MILYHAVSTYQLLHCIVHKEVFYKDKTCHLILPEFIKDKFTNYMELEGSFFDKVYTFGLTNWKRGDENLIENVNGAFITFFNENNIKLVNYDEIIVGCPHYYFGIYLVANDIKFTFIEDASGMLSRPDFLRKIIENVSPYRYKVSEEYGLFTGRHDAIQKIICNENVQVEDYDLSGLNIEHFDLVEEMNNLGNPFVDKIINFFSINEKIFIKENSIVILTQHFNNLNLLSFDEQKNIYQLIVDYFASEYNIVFKPHPDDRMYYDMLFPDSINIQTKFPSELIPFVFTQRPKAVMTITSTSINSLVNYFKNPIRFSMNFEKQFEITHRYYCALRIISELDSHISTIHAINTDISIINNLAKHSELNLKNKKIVKSNFKSATSDRIVIIDDIEQNKSVNAGTIKNFLNVVSVDAIVIFLNSNNQYLFYDYPNKEVMKYLIPIEIVHTNSSDKRVDKIETVYIFSKRSEIRDMANKIKLEKDLKNLNKTLSVSTLSDEQIRIKILEGILEATEKRLNYYISKDNELKLNAN